jgi:hypothetical protein
MVYDLSLLNTLTLSLPVITVNWLFDDSKRHNIANRLATVVVVTLSVSGTIIHHKPYN